mgnify:CR=1 FL=1
MKKYKEHVEMGIEWVQIENNEKINKFNAQTKCWPSLIRVEIIAILTAILVAKESSTINIFTDFDFLIKALFIYFMRENLILCRLLNELHTENRLTLLGSY